jgi:hypothetical protein
MASATESEHDEHCARKILALFEEVSDLETPDQESVLNAAAAQDAGIRDAVRTMLEVEKDRAPPGDLGSGPPCSDRAFS